MGVTGDYVWFTGKPSIIGYGRVGDYTPKDLETQHKVDFHEAAPLVEIS
jgi:hypothetical protein